MRPHFFLSVKSVGLLTEQNTIDCEENQQNMGKMDYKVILKMASRSVSNIMVGITPIMRYEGGNMQLRHWSLYVRTCLHETHFTSTSSEVEYELGYFFLICSVSFHILQLCVEIFLYFHLEFSNNKDNNGQLWISHLVLPIIFLWIYGLYCFGFMEKIYALVLQIQVF